MGICLMLVLKNKNRTRDAFVDEDINYDGLNYILPQTFSFAGCEGWAEQSVCLHVS